MSTGAKASSEVEHPYLPKDLKLPHYVSNVRSTQELLAVLSFVSVLVLVAAWVLSGYRKEPFCLMRRLVLCWFMLCAFIHIFVEGYFSVYHASVQSDSSILGELWKEYSKCDSRYVGSETFIVCMERVTAIAVGPLAFLTFFAFLWGSNYRYSLQLILSLCQLYGDVLYFITSYKDNFIHGPTDHLLYFYFYFVFLNGLWIVIPSLLIVDSSRHIAACQTVSDFYIDEYNRRHGINTENNSKKLK